MHYEYLMMLFTEIIMQDTMNDEFLSQRDISSADHGMVALFVFYVVIPILVYVIAEFWQRWKKR